MWENVFLGAVGFGASIAGAITGAKATERQAEILSQRADIRREEGGLARRSAFDRARRARVQGQAFVGAQKSAFAGAGVATDKGSPLSVLRETQKSIQTDVSRTRQLGENAFTLGVREAGLLQEQAKNTALFGNQQLVSNVAQGATSFLGTLTQASIYKNFWEN